MICSFYIKLPPNVKLTGPLTVIDSRCVSLFGVVGVTIDVKNIAEKRYSILDK